MLNRRDLGRLAIAAAVMPQALSSELPINVWLMGDSDFIAARSAAEARQWYLGWVGVDQPEVTEWSDGDTFADGNPHDPASKILTFRQAIDEHAAYGGEFPCYLATDGHYC